MSDMETIAVTVPIPTEMLDDSMMLADYLQHEIARALQRQAIAENVRISMEDIEWEIYDTVTIVSVPLPWWLRLFRRKQVTMTVPVPMVRATARVEREGDA